MDLTGQRFGRLVVQGLAPRRRGVVMWQCLCDCGTVKDVQQHNLQGGYTQSCGCLQKERAKKKATRHGHAKTRNGQPTNIYKCWQLMLARCYRPRNNRYKYYGARGITVCERWRHSFQSFYEDMGDMPAPDMTIERKDNDLGYSPENCRWATRAEQASNKSNNHLLTFQGETKTIAAWGRYRGWKPGLIYTRLWCGWSIERALTTPPRPSKPYRPRKRV